LILCRKKVDIDVPTQNTWAKHSMKIL